MTLTDKIKALVRGGMTEQTFAEFWQWLHDNDMDYHPDDDAHEIVKCSNGEPVFTSAEAELMNHVLCLAYKVLQGACDIACDISLKELREADDNGK